MTYYVFPKSLFNTFILLLITISAFSQELEDVTSAMGVFQYSSNQRYGTGISAFDIDDDGWLDLHVSTAYGTKDFIYKNMEGQGFREVSSEVGLTLTGGSIASIWMDYDGDRLVDLLIMNSCSEVDSCAGKTLQLFKQNVDGTFMESTEEAGLAIFSQEDLGAIKGGLSAGDLNLDGYLDIVLTHWEFGEIFILLNDGAGHFINAGMDLGISNFNENYFQPLIWDVDIDGDLDLYVNADAGPNKLFLNNNFEFSENALSYGLAANNNEMGIAIGDFNNDEAFDLFMTNIDYLDLFNVETGTFNVLYQGLGSTEAVPFRNVADDQGVKRSGWGWGTTFLDINNNGFQDLAATNGIDNGSDQSKFWLNQGGTSFLDFSDNIGFNDNLDGTSLISIDYDQDGDLDLLQTINTYENQETSIKLLRNNCPTCGNYLIVRPRMEGKNHFGIGATVKITAGDKTMQRLITAGTSFYGQEAAEAHFGLGTAALVDSITIIWPGGAKSIVRNILPNQILEITDSEILQIPRFFKTEKEDGWVYLGWNHISSNETFFEIETADNPAFSNSQIYEVTTPLRQDSFPDNSTGTIFLRIRASNDQISSDWSPMTWIGKFIAAPTNLKITNEDDLNPVIEWADNSMNESGFVLERSNNLSFSTTEITNFNADITRFQETNLLPNRRYYYRVAATDSLDYYSDYSNILVHEVPEEITTPTQLAYPNPASTYVFLPINLDQVNVMDAAGKQFTMYKTEEGYYNIQHLPQGVYFVIGNFPKKIIESLRFVKIAPPR